MLPTLTYLQFHLVFSLPIVALLWYLAPRYEPTRRRRATAGIAILVAIAYLYTTPWISYMIRRGAWGYADGAVLVRALSIPLGEYLFFTVQTVVTAFALHLIGFDPTFREGDFDRAPRAAGVVVGLAMVPIGLGLASLDPSYLYLGGLIAWVGPVLALQWGVGGGYLVRTPRTWLAATFLPAAYFWVADRIAIGMGTWYLSPELTTGIAVLGLPVEEMLFFASAGVMTVNGLVLFEWVLDWNDRRRAVAEPVAGGGSEASDPDVPGPEPPTDPDPDVVDD
ncbi:lycopene cyclase domain-containing protein [Halorubrum sp. GN11_10-6_MGM]|uniref:lycopene cyclase domain-containing protein n=1 Tax=Halorubrum sp. GN11_10-6_MGM TaxID=2518112 RepID=UPI0010F87C91|nr:lycopene cyclase domain-containing protein [Halorubrum sp. GN11_10-6_MGM]TKX76059.1 lycopene cyclase domain-containing protein [Halorubrum sp. GN11_10-6_MGM]